MNYQLLLPKIFYDLTYLFNKNNHLFLIFQKDI